MSMIMWLRGVYKNVVEVKWVKQSVSAGKRALGTDKPFYKML